MRIRPFLTFRPWVKGQERSDKRSRSQPSPGPQPPGALFPWVRSLSLAKRAKSHETKTGDPVRIHPQVHCLRAPDLTPSYAHGRNSGLGPGHPWAWPPPPPTPTPPARRAPGRKGSARKGREEGTEGTETPSENPTRVRRPRENPSMVGISLGLLGPPRDPLRSLPVVGFSRRLRRPPATQNREKSMKPR